MNERKLADLHMHSTHSDGVDTPERMVRRARDAGLACISITDHDSCSALEESLSAGEQFGVEVIPGIEVSTHMSEKSVHILGYMMDVNSDIFREILTCNTEGRMERMKSMVAKLNDLGYKVDLEDLLSFIGGGTVGRALLARYLVHRGFFGSVEDVFNRILGDGKAVYEPVPKFTPAEAIKIIAKAGGVSSLAHPGYTAVDDEIPMLVEEGLDGIEVFSPQHAPNMESHYLEITERYGLLVTGGSDCHGAGNGWRNIGSVKLPYGYVERLKERAARVAAPNG